MPAEDEEGCLSPESTSLITQLLERDPLLRLGTELGAAEVKDAPFFEGVDWRNLLCQKAAFVPQLEHDEDCSYFDPRTDRYHHEVEDDEDLDFELLHPLLGPPSAPPSSASSMLSTSSRSVSKEQLNELVGQPSATTAITNLAAGEEVTATLTAADAKHTAERLHSAINMADTSCGGAGSSAASGSVVGGEEPSDEALFHAFASCTPRFSIAMEKAALEVSQSDGEQKQAMETDEVPTTQDEITPTKKLQPTEEVGIYFAVKTGLIYITWLHEIQKALIYLMV